MTSCTAAPPKHVRQSLRIGVFGWLVLWILTVPLFHIHTVSETRQGLPHTVFSPDLPGEYSAGPGESFLHDSPRNGRHHSGIHNGQSYPELGFMTPLPQAGKSLKPFQIMAYGAIPLLQSPGSTLRRHPTPTNTADLAKDQTQVAKQGRGGHDDPPGDDHDGLVVIG